VNLADSQKFVARALQATVIVDDQPEGPSVTPRFVAGSARLTPTAQLEIYREQFWLRHVDAIKDDYATLFALLGHDAFHSLAEAYLAAHPPTAFSLRDLGADLPVFVATHAPYSEDRLLLDCARLEWAFVEAFDAADATPIAAEAIAAVDEDAWAGARLSFHPALYVVSLEYPAHDYRTIVRRGEDVPRPERAPAHVAIYRGTESLQYVEIEPLANALYERLAHGEPLGDACEAVASTVPHGALLLEEKVGAWFQFWAASGWITAIQT
jgi:hypothetical protein